MYCSNCGTQLPDDASFCLKCGKSVVSSNPKSVEEKWETCEIVCENYESSMSFWDRREAGFQEKHADKLFGETRVGGTYKFVVKVFSQVGVSVIKTTNNYYLRDDPRQAASKEIDKMTAELVKEGWEATGKGERWYSYKFRRRVV